MKGTIKLMAPLAAALAIAACNGSSNMPATTGGAQAGQSMASLKNGTPDWTAYREAQLACPAIIGKPTCLALMQTTAAAHPPVAGIAPVDIQTRYKLPIRQGKGQIVAIVDAYDQPNASSDLATYRTQFGLGTAKFTKYNQNGQTTNYPQSCTVSSSWCVEEDLDIEMVSAACPRCKIYLVENDGTNAGFDDALKTAVRLGAHIVSNSWICYQSLNCGDRKLPKIMSTKGVIYTAGSGDAGYNMNGAPEALATVVSVGGTNLIKSGSNYTENVWPDAGGGCSNNGSGQGIAKPSWQHDPSCTYRTDADVAAVANGVAEYDSLQGGWFEVGGTSVATPINAAIFALAGNAGTQNAGEAFWKLKRHARKHDLHYISSGSDGSCGGSYLCTAGTKQFKTYAGPIGWGTPNGINAY